MADADAECIATKMDEINRIGQGRVHILTGDQANLTVLERWRQETGDVAFDFIVDDGGHRTDEMWRTLTKMWHWLAPGGVIVVEDMGTTATPKNVRRLDSVDVPTRSFIDGVTYLLRDLGCR